MGNKKICTIEGEYLHEGERRVCKFNITARKIGKYKTLRMDANPKGQKRISITRPTLEEIKEEFRKWQEINRPHGESLERKLTRLTEEQIVDAENAVRLIPSGLTLVEAVEIASGVHLAKEIALKDAYKRYVVIQKRSRVNRDGNWSSQKTLAEFKTVMKYPLIELGDKNVKSISGTDLWHYWNLGNKALKIQNLASKKKQKLPTISDQSRKNRFKVLQKFFNWCLEMGYHHKNIMKDNSCPTPKVRKADKQPPQILNNSKTIQLLDIARGSKKYFEWIPYLAFLHFAGVRPGEANGNAIDETKVNRAKAKPLTWDNFRLDPQFEDPYVQLPYTGKMESNRPIKIPKNLVNILKVSKQSGIPFFCPKITSNTMRRFRAKAGLTKANAARHTAISNWYRYNPMTNKPASQQELTDQFGNREDTRAEFYINTEEIGIAEAKRYWSIGLKWKSISTF